MTTPELYLATGYLVDERGRIVSTLEPNAEHGPYFVLVRGVTQTRWAIHADVPDDVAAELERLADDEAPARHARVGPAHADRYVELVSEVVRARVGVDAQVRAFGGPAFRFPDALPDAGPIAIVDDEARLADAFTGWVPGEIAAGRAPVIAVEQDGMAVSICFCARRSDAAAEAGVDTALAWRRRGFGKRVVSAWATAIRASDRVPLYSTFWRNEASLALARSLGLARYADHWSLRLA